MGPNGSGPIDQRPTDVSAVMSRLHYIVNYQSSIVNNYFHLNTILTIQVLDIPSLLLGVLPLKVVLGASPSPRQY
jgi:hypothetical protein